MISFEFNSLSENCTSKNTTCRNFPYNRVLTQTTNIEQNVISARGAHLLVLYVTDVHVQYSRSTCHAQGGFSLDSNPIVSFTLPKWYSTLKLHYFSYILTFFLTTGIFVLIHCLSTDSTVAKLYSMNRVKRAFDLLLMSVTLIR